MILRKCHDEQDEINQRRLLLVICNFNAATNSSNSKCQRVSLGQMVLSQWLKHLIMLMIWLVDLFEIHLIS